VTTSQPVGARNKPFGHLVRTERVPVMTQIDYRERVGREVGREVGKEGDTMLRTISARAVGFGLPLAAVAVLAAACGGSNAPTASGGVGTSTASSATSSSTTTASTGAVTLKTENGTAGIWLADQTGRTLYMYTVDQGTTSGCYGACATAWPPLTTTGSVAVAGSATAGQVGTTTRTDGTKQVTYAGHPLYYFKGDTSPGMTKGQGLQSVWFLLGPSGNVMRSAPPPPATAPPATTPKPGGGWA
jgi:predicted lipoprotein with Yx(FWY)xxD motif